MTGDSGVVAGLLSIKIVVADAHRRRHRHFPAAFLAGDFGEAKVGVDGVAFAVEAVR